MKHWVAAFGLVVLAGGAARAETAGVEPTQKRDNVLLEFPVQELGAGGTTCVGHFSCAHMALGPTDAVLRPATAKDLGVSQLDVGNLNCSGCGYAGFPPIATHASPVTITFGPGTPGEVTIDTGTGAVSYRSTPDEAARAFWKAVQGMAPEYLREAK